MKPPKINKQVKRSNPWGRAT